MNNDEKQAALNRILNDALAERDIEYQARLWGKWLYEGWYLGYVKPIERLFLKIFGDDLEEDV